VKKRMRLIPIKNRRILQLSMMRKRVNLQRSKSNLLLREREWECHRSSRSRVNLMQKSL
jgi:hypothetical protein